MNFPHPQILASNGLRPRRMLLLNFIVVPSIMIAIVQLVDLEQVPIHTPKRARA